MRRDLKRHHDQAADRLAPNAIAGMVWRELSPTMQAELDCVQSRGAWRLPVKTREALQRRGLVGDDMQLTSNGREVIEWARTNGKV